MLECPLYSFIRDEFSSLLENIVPRSLESIFQLDHQAEINLFIKEATALHHSRKLVGLQPS